MARRETEIDREIVAFSISHNHTAVRIYGHYPVIKGKDSKYYRHLIREFDFTELGGQEKWTACKLTRNVYDLWMPTHLKRIHSVLEMVPEDLSFAVPPLSEGGFSQSWLAQGLENHHFSEPTGQGARLEGPKRQLDGDVGGAALDVPGRRASKRARKKKSSGIGCQ
jgi:hypothetical protein